MRIGIDIDDTTLMTVNSMIKYAKKYNEEVLHRKHETLNIGKIKDRYYLTTLFGWDENTKIDFFKKFYKKVLKDCKPLHMASEVISKLKNDGNEIYFISARINNVDNCNAEEITIDCFAKYKIPYDKLIIGAYNKLDYCLDNKIDVFIDDSIEVLKELSNNGIRCYFMSSKINEFIDSGDIPKIRSWLEIYENLKGVLK